jgi:hypothetical protein
VLFLGRTRPQRGSTRGMVSGAWRTTAGPGRAPNAEAPASYGMPAPFV